jgi:hypothetical protein
MYNKANKEIIKVKDHIYKPNQPQNPVGFVVTTEKTRKSPQKGVFQ